MVCGLQGLGQLLGAVRSFAGCLGGVEGAAGTLTWLFLCPCVLEYYYYHQYHYSYYGDLQQILLCSSLGWALLI